MRDDRRVGAREDRVLEPGRIGRAGRRCRQRGRQQHAHQRAEGAPQRRPPARCGWMGHRIPSLDTVETWTPSSHAGVRGSHPSQAAGGEEQSGFGDCTTMKYRCKEEDVTEASVLRLSYAGRRPHRRWPTATGVHRCNIVVSTGGHRRSTTARIGRRLGRRFRGSSVEGRRGGRRGVREDGVERGERLPRRHPGDAREQALAEPITRPNLNAQACRRTGSIGMVVPRLDEPYFAELARWVVTAANERHWTVLVDQTEGDPAREAFVVGTNRPRLLDGVILSPLALDDDALHNRDPGVPLVLLGERVTPASRPTRHRQPRRRPDRDRTPAGNGSPGDRGDRQPTGPEVAHLPAAVAGFPGRDAGGRHSCPRAADRRGRVVPPAGWRGRRAGDVRRGERPDALFCFNDLLAHGAIRALTSGFGCRRTSLWSVSTTSSFSVPTVSSIAPDKEQLAHLAVSALAERLEATEPPPPREISATFELRVRESSTVRRSAEPDRTD